MVTLDYVRLWLKRARMDAEAALLIARRDDDSVLALYLVQQSIEKACKALLLAAGKKYSQVVGFRHNSLNVFLSFVKTFIQIEWMRQSIRDLIAPDIYEEFDRVAEWAGNPARHRWFWTGLASYDKAVVSNLLNIQKHCQNRRMQISKKIRDSTRNSPPIIIESSQPEVIVSVIEEYVIGNLGHLIEARIDFISTVARGLIDMVGIHRLDEEVSQTGKVTFTSKQISMAFNSQFRFGELMVGLYIMSVITLPHEAYTRYPSNPERGGKPPLGCEQYDSLIGAFFHIKRLSKSALNISKNLHDNAAMITGEIQNSLAVIRSLDEE